MSHILLLVCLWLTSVTALDPDFKTSCVPAVKHAFNVGLKNLYGGLLDKAWDSFFEVTTKDPDCAIGYWGLSMTLWDQTQFFPPTEQQKKEGSKQIDKAYEIGKRTASILTLEEKHLIRAMFSYHVNPYKHADRYEQHYKRVELYVAKMEEAYKDSPNSIEMKALYALSILTSQVWVIRRSYEKMDLVATLCRDIAEKNPDHTSLRYLLDANNSPKRVHLTTDVELATYARFEPRPNIRVLSEAYTLNGQWDKVIALEKFHLFMRTGKPLDAADFLSLDALSNAYLQAGQTKLARQIVQNYMGAATETAEVDQFHAAFYFANIMGRIFFYEANWAEASQYVDDSGLLDTEYRHMINMITTMIHALGHFHLEDQQQLIEDVEFQIQNVKSLHTTAPRLILPNAVKAEMNKFTIIPEVLLKFLFGGVQVAVEDLKELTETHEIGWHHTPMFSIYQLLGDFQTKMGQHCSAFESYEASLEVYPNRVTTLFKAGSAAEKCGEKTEDAKRYYQEFLVAHFGFEEEHAPGYEHVIKFLGLEEKHNKLQEEIKRRQEEEAKATKEKEDL